jgi:hypothetical protein
MMVAASSDRHPQPTTSLLMIILKVSCRTSPFSGPQRQSAARGARDVIGYGMAPVRAHSMRKRRFASRRSAA